MKIDGKIASVYASALFDLVENESDLVAVEEELSELTSVFVGDKKTWAYLQSPIVDPIEKEALLARSLKGRVSTLLENFTKILARRRRMNALPEIAQAFIILVDKKIGRKHAIVKTPKKLSPENLNNINKALASYFNKEIIIEEKIVPELIGGLVINTGDIVIDSSISRKLKRINTLMREHKIFGETFYEN